MAEPQIYYNPRDNPLSSQNELGKGLLGSPAPIKKSGTLTYTSLLSRTSISALAPFFALALVILVAKYIDENLQ